MFDLTRRTEQVLNIIVPREARNSGARSIRPEHVLRGILRLDETAGLSVLRQLGIDIIEFTRALDDGLSRAPMSDSPAREASWEQDARPGLLVTAWQIAGDLRNSHVGTEHLLLALLVESESTPDPSEIDEGDGEQFSRHEYEFIEGLFASFSLNYRDARAVVNEWLNAGEVPATGLEPGPFLNTFALDWTRSDVDIAPLPIRGRESEVQFVMRVLGRRRRDSLILLGPPGVGKTSIVHEIARRLRDGKVPEYLRGKHLAAVNCALMEDDLELVERLDRILRRLRGVPNVILFLDHIQDLPEMHAETLAFALKGAESQCIAATSIAPEEWRAGPASPGLSRRLRKLRVGSVEPRDVASILRDLRPELELRYQARLADETLDLVHQAAEQRRNSGLPGAAVQLLDETGAYLYANRSDVGETGLSRDLIERIADELFPGPPVED